VFGNKRKKKFLVEENGGEVQQTKSEAKSLGEKVFSASPKEVCISVPVKIIKLLTPGTRNVVPESPKNFFFSFFVVEREQDEDYCRRPLNCSGFAGLVER